MGRSTAVEDYPRALKMAAITDAHAPVCNYRFYFRLTPPEDLLEYKNLFTHIVFTFGASIPSGQRIIRSVGIANEIPVLDFDPSYVKRITKNWAADANRRIEITLDLSSMIQATEDNWVEVTFPREYFYGVNNFGDFDIWKIDLVYTTTGVSRKR